jgi:mono/diheme cytochrome c family protein
MRTVSVIAATLIGLAAAIPTNAGPSEVSFAKQVLPIFMAHCASCHSPGGVGYISSNMDLTNYRSLQSGSMGGIAVIPFHSDRSALIRYLDTNWHSQDLSALKMPPPPQYSQLPDADIATIRDWIDQGAKNN